MRKNLFLAGTLSFVSLLAGASALVLAELGAPVYFFLPLLAWLLTAGLPTLAAVLLLASVWPGPSFGLFVAVAAVLAFLFQWAAVGTIRQTLRRRRTV